MSLRKALFDATSLCQRFTALLVQTKTILPSSLRSTRCLSSNPEMSSQEKHIFDVIEKNFPEATKVKVEDISGGCGAMFDVHIQSPAFVGLPLVKQHMLVNKALKAEIKDMHGIRITTTKP